MSDKQKKKKKVMCLSFVTIGTCVSFKEDTFDSFETTVTPFNNWRREDNELSLSYITL